MFISQYNVPIKIFSIANFDSKIYSYTFFYQESFEKSVMHSSQIKKRLIEKVTFRKNSF